MKGYNVIAVFDVENSCVLLCKRRKDPYKNLYNLVGGKIEPDETHIAAAYRELFEETSITSDSVDLVHIMDYKYYIDDCFIEVYAGVLKHSVEVSGDENELEWVPLSSNFCDSLRFAGNGNLSHVIHNCMECLDMQL